MQRGDRSERGGRGDRGDRDDRTLEADALPLFTENDRLTHREHPTLRVQALANVPFEVCQDRLGEMRAALGAIFPTIPDSCLHNPTE